MSESRAIEQRVRRHLKRIGYRLHKDAAVIRSPSHQGNYMVATPAGSPLLGHGYTATLDEVESWLLTENSGRRA